MTPRIYVAVAAASAFSVLFKDSLLELVFRIYPAYQDSPELSASNFETGRFVFYTVVFSCLLLLSIAYYKALTKTVTGVVLFNSVYYCFISCVFFSFIPLFNRIYLFLEINIMLFVPYLLSIISNQKQRMFYSVAICVVMMFVFFFTVAVIGRYGVVPYHFSM